MCTAVAWISSAARWRDAAERSATRASLSSRVAASRREVWEYTVAERVREALVALPEGERTAIELSVLPRLDVPASRVGDRGTGGNRQEPDSDRPPSPPLGTR